MNSESVYLTKEEKKLLDYIRNLGAYQKIEIKLNDNRHGRIVYTITTNIREEFES